MRSQPVEDEQERLRTAAGANVRVCLHLFFSPEQKARAARHFAAEVEQIIAIKNKSPGGMVPLELWTRISGFVLKGTVEDKDGKERPFWGRSEAKINQALEFEDCLALRTSDPMNPREALALYSDRNIIESDFRIMKVDNECNRLQCTKPTRVGKLFLYCRHRLCCACLAYTPNDMPKRIPSVENAEQFARQGV